MTIIPVSPKQLRLTTSKLALYRDDQKKRSRYTRPAINRALGLAQEQMLFDYIARLDFICISAKARILHPFANANLKFAHPDETRKVGEGWGTRFIGRKCFQSWMSPSLVSSLSLVLIRDTMIAFSLVCFSFPCWHALSSQATISSVRYPLISNLYEMDIEPERCKERCVADFWSCLADVFCHTHRADEPLYII